MITYSDSFLQFLSESNCRIAKILLHARDSGFPAYRLMITNKLVDYITFRNDGTISFLPAGKPHKVTDNGTWARDGRQSGKPGKVIQKLFTPAAQKLIPVKEFESFTNQYKAEFCNEGYSFELKGNKAIPSVYDMDRAGTGGTLNDSCMNGDTDYMDIYRYCNKVKILTLVNESKELCGRALVWKVSDTLTILDRIYVVKDFMYDMFLNYARDNDWYHKRDYTTYDGKQYFVKPDGETVCLQLKIDTRTDFDKYPYIDTFSYGGDGYINNYGDGPYTYDCTDGTRASSEEDEDDSSVWDEIDNCNICEDDAVMVDRGRYRNCYTHRDNVVEPEGTGSYYWKDDDLVMHLSYDDKYYLTDDVVWSEYDQEDYPLDDCVFCEHEDSYILRCDSEEVDGVIYHKDNVPEPEEEEEEVDAE